MKKSLIVLALLLTAGAVYANDLPKTTNGVIATATAVINEAANTADHACRMTVVTPLWRNPPMWAQNITPWLTSQSITEDSAQQAINDGISAWLTTEVTVRKAEGSCR